mgnify:CR=1 FL=1|jgi:hypothetical protein
MTDSGVADTAFTLAEMTSNDSVTMALLAGREGRFTKESPLNDPPVTYLEGTEAPAYALTNAKRGIGRGVKTNTVTPDGDYRTVVLVTGRRTLCLVGKATGDEVIEIPHDAVAAVSYSRGLRKHRLVLRTPESAYHCWVHRKTDTALLEDVTDFIADRQIEEPDTIDDEGPSRVMYRGQPVYKSGGRADGSDGTAADGDDGGEAADGDDGGEAADEDDSEEEFTVTYRGLPVDKE